MTTKLCLALGAAAALASPLSAQDAQFRQIVESANANAPTPAGDMVKASLLETLQAIARDKGQCVPTGVAVHGIESATAVRAVVLSVQSGQLRNAWTVYGRGEGCEGAPQLRFILLGLTDGGLRVAAINEGESLANLSLMQDASSLAALSAFQLVRAAEPQCAGDGMQMGPTRILERSADLGPNYHGVYFSGSWKEAWTFTVCGKSAEVPVEFTPDGQSGASFRVVGTEARLLD